MDFDLQEGSADHFEVTGQTTRSAIYRVLMHQRCGEMYYGVMYYGERYYEPLPS